jgi:hypothetical protein
MSGLNSGIAAIGIDIGKNSFHVVGQDCESASNLDPGRWRRKPLSDMRFLENGWGHDWTPTKPT